eukprot:snap_masked-scaffold514_size150699-processed-gene-0.9 protein:Tk01732 transcript:snap_masked-scaffold514_size150699-processed-gene-0.9-mRNA-1 annotation:"transmembrane protein 32-b precursor"
MFHAAYSVAEWRNYSRKTDQTSESLPLDIVIQTLVAFFLAMVSVLNIAGEFKEIRSAMELSQKSWEHSRNRPSFYTFNHRGKSFSPDYVPPNWSVAAFGGGLGEQRSLLTEIPDKFLS